MSKDRTRAINALNSLARSNKVDIDAKKKLTPVQIEEISRWRAREDKLSVSIAQTEGVRLVKHILEPNEHLSANENLLDELVRVSEATPRREETGFKAIAAAKRFVAWSPE